MWKTTGANFAVAVGGVLCVCGLALGIEINNYSSTRNNRFYPSPPSANPNTNFIGLGYDWSGIGWNTSNSTQSFALLGPQFFLYANHYTPSVGATFQYVSADGQYTSPYTVQSVSGSLAGDLAVGMFSTPISKTDNVRYYPILFQGYAASNYVGYDLLMYGWTAKIGWNQINRSRQFTGDSGYYYDFLFDTTTPDRGKLVGGDSGSPSFIVTGLKGEMYLAGAHYAVYNDGSGGIDSFLALELSTINSYMAQWGYLPYVATPVTDRWTGATSSSWNNAGNWSNGVVPEDDVIVEEVQTCAAVLFDGGATSNLAVNLNGNQTVTGVNFASAAGANAFTISRGTSGTLTIGEAGITNNDNEVQTLTCPIALRDSQRWTTGQGGLLISGTINLGTYNNLLLVEGDGNVTISGAISGTGALAKDGAGTLLLSSSAGNSYTGKTFIHGGTIAVSRDNHLGAAPGSTVADKLTINSGVLRATDTFTLNSNRGISLGALGGTLTVDSGKTLAVDSIIAGSGAALTKAGSGNLALTNGNTYSGATKINNGVLTLSGSNGAVTSSPGLTLYYATILQLDNSAANNTNRLGNSAAISLAGGTLGFQGSASAASSETAGTLTLNSDDSTINVASGAGQTATLTLAGLVRQSGATVNFTGTGLGAGGNNPSLVITGLTNTNGIIGGYAACGADWATVGANGITPLSFYQTSLNPGTWVSSDNVKITGTLAADIGAQTINSLNLAVGGTINQTASTTLTLTSGGILCNTGTAADITGGTLSAGELIVHNLGSGALSISSIISGTSLVKAGQGALILNNTNNNYSGNTTVNAGTLKLGASGAVPSGSNLTVAGGGFFDLAGHSQTVANISVAEGTISNSGAAIALSLGGNGGAVSYTGVSAGGMISVNTLNLATGAAASAPHTFTVADGEAVADMTISSVIADGSTFSQSLVKAGSGTLTLSGSNIYTGSTSIQAGTLALGASNALPSGSALTVNGGTLAIDGFSSTVGAVTLQNGNISGTTGVLSSSSLDVRNGAISAVLGGTGALTKNAAGAATLGTVVLSASNTYSGGTYLNAGALSVGDNSQLGAAGGALNFNGGTLQIKGTGFTSTSRSIAWNAGGGGFDIVDQTNVFILSTSQSLGGTGQLTKQGQGTLIVNGTVGSSNVTIEDGTLRTGAANRFTSAPTITLLYNDAVLDLNGYNDTVGNLALSGGTVQTGTGTLTLQGNVTFSRSIWPALISGKLYLDGTNHVFDISSGSADDVTISAVISGSGGSITKSGDGVLTFSGANTYSGATTISNGYLQIGSGGTTGTLGTGPVVDNAILAFYRSNSISVSNAVSGAGSLQQFGSGTLTLSASNSYSGGTMVYAGTLKVGNSSALGSTLGDMTVSSGAILDLNGYSMTLGSLSGQGAVSISGVKITIGANNSSTTFGGAISGNGQLTKIGAGILTFTGANTYTGATTISGGTLRVGDGGTTGALGSGAVTDNAILAFNRSNSITVSNAISGSGGLLQTGSGTLTLSGSNSYSGGTTISTGTLKLNNTYALGSILGDMSVSSGAVLDLNGYSVTLGSLNGQGAVSVPSGKITIGANNSSTTFTGVISGNGQFTKIGAGILTLTGTNTYTGTTTISSGTLQVGDGGALGTASVVDDALLFFNRSDTITVSNAISGTGGLQQIGSGILTLSGANSFSGMTTVANGTLKLGNVSALGSTAEGTLVQSGGVLDLNGLSIGDEALTINGDGGGDGALINSNVSTAALYGGAVSIGSNSAIGGSGNTTISGSLNYGTFNLTKLGTSTLTLTGTQNWGNDAAAIVQNGALTYQQSSTATTSVATGTAILQIASGAVVNVDASNKDPFTDDVTTTNHVQILNDAAGGLNLTAGVSTVAGISGAGSTNVSDGATLTTSYICQGGLTIAADAKLIINGLSESGDLLPLHADSLSALESSPLTTGDLAAVLDSGTDAGTSQENSSVVSSGLSASADINGLNSVPEPSTTLLLLLGAISGIMRFFWKRNS